ncbi:hypothetical protein BBF96_07625 [Anoxybacter fermentans]|uniref:Uncharacterized protein n=1 Tax=Anoxybacter fermentans TaxID=1323375 RepID=A0A3Q9HQR5_9FIRM|nr:hypothetical protein BBF96_07625 [Anoxybacter fermentans]
MKGIREIEHSMKEGRLELQIQIDRKRAAQMGLRTSQIAMTVRSAIQGGVPNRYKVDGKEYDLRVQLKWDDRNLENLLLTASLGTQVPLS